MSFVEYEDCFVWNCDTCGLEVLTGDGDCSRGLLDRCAEYLGHLRESRMSMGEQQAYGGSGRGPRSC